MRPQPQQISAKGVCEMYQECIFKKGDELHHYRSMYTLQGITGGFHIPRLKDNAREIEEMIGDLPEIFEREMGASFVEAGTDRYGHPWTISMTTLCYLIQLGIAIGRIEPVPKEETDWTAYPGGTAIVRIIPKGE